ncbi:loganic acid O-methyltransferase-like isoform X1 [Salvia splendens]|uniref:loganic acid O-methyltransferase-like isoform X1 n=1 Tax=Salvia splendens TaxID=180675 RepID=UPI001C25EE20|nr:loganic acid O-methyltransferase-like isoform X1 [Salvia splendens]
MAESVPTTTSGDGPFSYAKNSDFQKDSANLVKEMIHEAIIDKLDADLSSSVSLVDLGCSVGPNTFLAVQNMIEALQTKTSASLEFEVFFNDHAANDFNKLFASLPQRKYHAAAVPGSFHGRLFSRGRITLAYSCFTLHYLSKVPEEIIDSKSPAWNKARIHYTNTDASPHVAKGYLEQFKRDLRAFLSARGEEIVKGGLMFLIIPGLAEGLTHSQSSYAVIFRLLESSVLELANEVIVIVIILNLSKKKKRIGFAYFMRLVCILQGVIGKGEVDGFNLAFYFPRKGEVREVIEEDGCFSVERAEMINPRSNIRARVIVGHLRAGMEGSFTEHFGESVMEKVFGRALDKADEVSDLLEASLRDSPQLFYVLKRK